MPDLSPEFIALAVCALAAQAYLVLALWHMARLKRNTAISGAYMPPVSIMKPLCGNEPGLEDALLSFFTLDYPEYELVFGLSSADDPALSIVERLRALYPNVPTAVVVDGRRNGTNLKVGNLIKMYPSCRHQLIVVADSDVIVGKDTLRHLISDFADPEIGASSCLYRGKPVGGLASRLGAMFIDGWFIPSVLVDVGINGVDGCYGAMLGVRRETLDSFGGFAALADYLAEDNLIGRRAREHGWKVALNTETVTTLVSEADLGSLLTHELRWARTVRACRLKDQIASVVTYPLPVLAMLLAMDPSEAAFSLVGLYLSLRYALHFLGAAKLNRPALGDVWLVPVREWLSFGVWAASLFGVTVHWRGNDFRVAPDGRLLSLSEAGAIVEAEPEPASKSA